MSRSVRGFGAAALVCVWLAAPAAAEAAEPSLAVLDFEMVDTSGEVIDQRADHERRLRIMTETVARELGARGVYRVADLEPIRSQVDQARAGAWLHACNGCEVALARQVHADRVMVGHVNKVSTREMSLWVDVVDVGSGRRVLRESQDFRGDTDQSWQRATAFLLKRLQAHAPGEL